MNLDKNACTVKYGRFVISTVHAFTSGVHAGVHVLLINLL